MSQRRGIYQVFTAACALSLCAAACATHDSVLGGLGAGGEAGGSSEPTGGSSAPDGAAAGHEGRNTSGGSASGGSTSGGRASGGDGPSSPGDTGGTDSSRAGAPASSGGGSSTASGGARPSPTGGAGNTAPVTGGQPSGGSTGSGQAGAEAAGATQTGTGGEGAASGTEPRVLVVDVENGVMSVYDRLGRRVREFGAELDFGSAFATPEVVAEHVDYSATFALPRLTAEAKGLEGPQRPSSILIHALRDSAESGRARVVSMTGQRLDEIDVPGERTYFELSPERKYVYASALDPSTSELDHSVVLERKSGALVWEGILRDSGFARDDSHFLFIGDTGDTTIVDLESGAATAASPFTSIEAVSSEGAVMTKHASTGDRLSLWWLDWQAQSAPFDPDTPAGAWDSFVAFLRQSRNVLWWRTYLEAEPASPRLPTGLNEFGVNTLVSDRLDTQPQSSCIQGDWTVYYQLDGEALQSCDCMSAACTNIAAVPPAEGGWIHQARSMPGGTVLIDLGWARDAGPEMFPDLLLYSPQGELLLSLPYGKFEVDVSGRLGHHRAYGPDGMIATGNAISVVDMATLTVTPIAEVGKSGIAYE
jgi:hypothetical protein